MSATISSILPRRSAQEGPKHLISLRVNEPIEKRQENDFQIQRHAPVAHVIEIVLDSMGDRSVTAAQTIDLSPASYAAFDVVPRHVPRDLLAEFLNEKREFGPRTNNTHVTLKNIDKLRQLVETGATEKSANRSDAFVVTTSVHRIRNMPILQFHRAKLKHFEATAIQTDAFLNKKDRASRGKFDRECDKAHERCRNK